MSRFLAASFLSICLCISGSCLSTAEDFLYLTSENSEGAYDQTESRLEIWNSGKARVILKHPEKEGFTYETTLSPEELVALRTARAAMGASRGSR
jgi:hypothetical protein